MNTSNLPLEDVLHEVIRSEAEPHSEAFARWSALFPQYQDDLEQFFTTWELEDFEAARRTEPGTDPPLAAAAKQYALEEMRSLGRVPATNDIPSVEGLDRLVLAAVSALLGRGTTAEIVSKVPRMMGARVLPGAVLASLNSLVERGLVVSWLRDGKRSKAPQTRKPEPRFRITLAGARALGISDIPRLPGTRTRNRPKPDEEVILGTDVDEILWSIAMETPVPTYDALVKWCGRYPQYREQISTDFLYSAIHEIRCGNTQRLIPLTDEERYAVQFEDCDAEEFALEILARQGRSMPPPVIRSLPTFDRNVLAAVYKLRGYGFRVDINHKVTQVTGARVIPTAVSASLERLEKLGLVIEWFGKPESTFKITIGGKQTLAKISFAARTL
jgi:hypothetical protein